MSLYNTRLQEFCDLLKKQDIDMDNFRKLCFNGIPDEQGLRALSWKLLLGYLPAKKAEWNSVLQTNRKLYERFIDEIVIPPGEQNLTTCADHPLSQAAESSWHAFFKDNEGLLLQIDKDVRRLCPDISFFQQSTDYPCKVVVNSSNDRRLYKRVAPSQLLFANVERRGLGMTTMKEERKGPSDPLPLEENSEAHWEVIERILFIYAKLNPGQGYVQGMNEIIGPIYYVFASDPNHEFKEHAEADSFFCFTLLMSEIRDFFIKTLDDTETGIKNMMEKLMSLLKEKDREVWQKLKDQELFPQYFCFRWITLLLSQEFPLPDVVRIWDSLFADPDRKYTYLIKVCCAMILLVRDQLLDGDFAANVKLLQNFPSIDIYVVLIKACSM